MIKQVNDFNKQTVKINNLVSQIPYSIHKDVKLIKFQRINNIIAKPGIHNS
jgi:hypothetical protein